ncbi:hypothetical protein B0T20DRAFT_401897 [Sordaria brevicollis]|uniref:Uncharacterized protein n=1 Tax=Sordaria brevicollis TaxID=83679 RepID=A0AAE0PKD9_SORBR|nr:hypothetical protein B0T20DRAFT_401897 [Sordaria brevicollis]
MPPPSATTIPQQQQDQGRTSNSNPSPPPPPPQPSSSPPYSPPPAPSLTDSEEAQQSYDEILDVLENFKLVLRGAIAENPYIDQHQKNVILIPIGVIVNEAHIKLGSGDGSTFKERMSQDEREEIQRWVQEKYDESQMVVQAVLETARAEAERELVELKEQARLAREISERMRTRAVERELKEGGQKEDQENQKGDQEKKEGVSSENNKNTTKPPKMFVLTPEVFVGMMSAVEARGGDLGEIVFGSDKGWGK